MQEHKNNTEKGNETPSIIENKDLNFGEALIPVIILMALLAYNIFAAGGEMFGGYSNQYILLIGGGIAALVGIKNKVTIPTMLHEIWENLKSVLYLL